MGMHNRRLGNPRIPRVPLRLRELPCLMVSVFEPEDAPVR